MIDLSENGPPEFTVAEIAKVLDMTPRGLSFKCKDKDGNPVPGVRKASPRLWLVSREKAIEWLREGRKGTGRPRKDGTKPKDIRMIFGDDDVTDGTEVTQYEAIEFEQSSPRPDDAESLAIVQSSDGYIDGDHRRSEILSSDPEYAGDAYGLLPSDYPNSD